MQWYNCIREDQPQPAKVEINTKHIWNLELFQILSVSVSKSMNIHRILQFGLELIIPDRQWRCKEYIPQIMNLSYKITSLFYPYSQELFYLNLFETCSLQLRLAWIFMDFQTGNYEFWGFLRVQKLVSVWSACSTCFYYRDFPVRKTTQGKPAEKNEL